MNVSKEADAAFMRELQDGDAVRYAGLHKNMLKRRAAKSGWIVGSCARCQGAIYNAPFLSASEPGEFCSHDCRDAGKDSGRVKCGRPRLTPKQRVHSQTHRREYQRNLMRNRRDDVLAKNSPQPIESTGVTDAILAI